MTIRKMVSALLICAMIVTSVSVIPTKAATPLDTLNELISTGSTISDSKGASALTWATKVDTFIKNQNDCIFASKIEGYCSDVQFFANVDSQNLRNKIVGHLMSYRDTINGTNPVTIQSVILEGNSITDTASAEAYKWVGNVNIINERYPNSSVYSNLKETVSDLQFYSKIDDQNRANKAMSYLSILEEEIPISSTLYAIKIKNQPYITSYLEGEKFNASGLVVEATYLDRYKNGTTGYSYKDVDGYTVNTTTPLKCSDYNWTVTYTENGITKTTAVSITVNPYVTKRELDKLYIVDYPTKISYVEGEKFNPTGMIVGATYKKIWTNGTVEYSNVENINYSINNVNKLTPNTKYVTVSYTENGVTKTLNVNVDVSKIVPPAVKKISRFKAKIKGKKIKLTWKKMGKINGYQIQISKSSSFSSASTINVSKKTVSYSKKLAKGKKYYFRIRAFSNYKDGTGKNNKSYGKWVKISKIIK